MMIGFSVFEIIKSIWMFWTTPVPLFITIAMFFFASIAVLAMGFMMNDAQQNIISRNEHEFYSNRDTMTNLSNIRYFKSKVQNLISREVPFAISMLLRTTGQLFK